MYTPQPRCGAFQVSGYETREITTMRRTSNVVKRTVLSDFGSQNEHLCGTEPESPRVVVIELPAGAGPKPTQLGIPDRVSTNFSSLVSTLPARLRCCTS